MSKFVKVSEGVYEHESLEEFCKEHGLNINIKHLKERPAKLKKLKTPERDLKLKTPERGMNLSTR